MFLCFAVSFLVVAFCTVGPSILALFEIYSELLFALLAALLSIVLIIGMWKTLKLGIMAQDSLWKWLLSDSVKAIIQEDSELEETLCDAFRAMVNASECNAVIAGLLIFFLFSPILGAQ